LNLTPPADSLVQMHQLVFDRLPLGIVIWEMENLADIYTLKLCAANAAASTASGIDLAMLVGKTVVDMVAPGTSPADMPPIFHAYQETIRTGEGRDLGEVRVDQEQLTSIYGEELGHQIFQIQTFPLPDHRAMGIFENITLRKQTEESLAARENQLRTVQPARSDTASASAWARRHSSAALNAWV
jgi:PAS domain-containing protein